MIDLHIIVHCSEPVHDRYTRFQVWTGKTWSDNLDDATTYSTYGKACVGMYDDVPEGKILGKLVAIPKKIWASLND